MARGVGLIRSIVTRARRINFWLLLFFVVSNSATALVVRVRWEARYADAEWRAFQLELGLDRLSAQIGELDARKKGSIHLYDTRRTDDLLGSLKGRADVTSLYIEMADVTDEGMRHVATLPSLRELTIYGGNPSVGDAGLKFLEQLASLESLALINTRVTDSGLGILPRLASLRRIRLFHEPQRGPYLTDGALAHLATLDRLEKAELAGGWVTPRAAEELRKQLPNCEIIVRRDPWQE